MIYFEKEDIDTGSMNGELMLSILSGLAQSESVSISANEKWSAQKRFEQGIFVIGFPPYGYRNENGRMVVVPEQAEVVRGMSTQLLVRLSLSCMPSQSLYGPSPFTSK